jgi:glycine betaine catabolism B
MITITVLNKQTGEFQENKLMPEVLAEGGGLIGRNIKCNLILNSSDVSRVHARIIYQGGQYYFSDLGSTSGSMVNDEEAETNQNFLLKPNDVIRIGDFALTVKEVVSNSNRSGNSVVAYGRMSAQLLVVLSILASLAAIAYIYLPIDSVAFYKFFFH